MLLVSTIVSIPCLSIVILCCEYLYIYIYPMKSIRFSVLVELSHVFLRKLGGFHRRKVLLIEVSYGYQNHLILVSGGFYPSEKYEFVSWNDEIPKIWKSKIQVPVTTDQNLPKPPIVCLINGLTKKGKSKPETIDFPMKIIGFSGICFP